MDSDFHSIGQGNSSEKRPNYQLHLAKTLRLSRTVRIRSKNLCFSNRGGTGKSENSKCPKRSSQNKVYSVLKKLIDLGLVTEVPGEPMRFSPTPPRVALGSYLQSYQDTVQNLLSLISTLEEAFRKAESRRNMRRSSMWTISGREEILKKIQEMLTRARRTVYIVTNENGLILLYRRFNKIFDELVGRSVKIKIRTADGANNRHLLRELRYVCNVEETDFHLPLIVLCIDENQILVSHLQPDSYFLKSEKDEAIFSVDPVLRKTIWSLVTQRNE